MIKTIEDIRQRSWDFALTVATMALLALLGVQSFVGTIVVWWAIRNIAGWEQSVGYTDYVNVMNAIAAPLIVALVVVMGLCVPKRLFNRTVLLWVSLGMLAVGVVAGIAAGSLALGLTVYLLLAAVIQLAVVVLTIAGVRGPTYLTEGRLTKTGSGMLHLGFIVFAIIVVALEKSPLMLPVFVLSAVLVVGGTALAFWAERIAWRRSGPQSDAPFEWDGAADDNADAQPSAADAADANEPDAEPDIDPEPVPEA